MSPKRPPAPPIAPRPDVAIRSDPHLAWYIWPCKVRTRIQPYEGRQALMIGIGAGNCGDFMYLEPLKASKPGKELEEEAREIAWKWNLEAYNYKIILEMPFMGIL